MDIRSSKFDLRIDFDRFCLEMLEKNKQIYIFYKMQQNFIIFDKKDDT